MGYIYVIVLILYAIVVITAIVTVLLDNRQPAKTMAWILVLVFLPVIGVVFYFFFGQNTRKEKLISQNSLDQLTKRTMLAFVEQQGLSIPQKHSSVVRMLSRHNYALPFKDNSVQVLTDGYAFFGSLIKDIASAKAHIHLSTYIFADDAIGTLIADCLCDKAKTGVEVRLIYDDVGCWSVTYKFFERMRDNGIDVHAFMPVHFPAFTSKVNYRNHRKLCVIDGRVGYIGGFNIADRYVKGKHSKPWRDTHLRITGGAVMGIQRAFLVDWYFIDRTLITSRKYYPPVDNAVQPPNNCVIQIVSSSPVSPLSDIMNGYVRILTEAKSYVYMETPYFLPTETVLFAMHAAVLAGVDVRLMIPKRTDTMLAQWASRSYVSQAALMGVRIYLYNTGFNHSKLLVCDDSLCSCGSTNIDFRSFENNFEANAFIYDETMARQMKDVFMHDVDHCELYDETRTGSSRPLHKRLWESIVRLLAPLL